MSIRNIAKISNIPIKVVWSEEGTDKRIDERILRRFWYIERMKNNGIIKSVVLK